MNEDTNQYSLNYLNVYLEYIYSILRERVERISSNNRQTDSYGNCYISDQEVMRILEEPLRSYVNLGGLKSGENFVSASNAKDNHAIEKILSLREEANEKGHTLTLEKVRDGFHLGDFEVTLLVLSVLIEMHGRFGKVLGFLNDDMNLCELTTGLALQLLSPTLDDRIHMRKHLGSSGTLFEYGLLRLKNRNANDVEKWITRPIVLDNDIFLYLTGQDFNRHEEDGRFWTDHQRELVNPIKRHPLLFEKLRSAVHGNRTDDSASMVLLTGRDGSGRSALVEHVCCRYGKKVILADVEAHIGSVNQTDTLLLTLIRDAVLYDALIFWEKSDVLFEKDNEALLRRIVNKSSKTGVKNIFSKQNDWRWTTDICSVPPTVIALPDTTDSERTDILNELLQNDNVPHDSIENLSEIYKFGRGELKKVVEVSRSLSKDNGESDGIVDADHLAAACRGQSNMELRRLSQLVVPKYSWDDIVLPEDNISQLREIVNMVLHTRHVYETWGFGSKASLGKGVGVVFSGQSGTGKTMASEIIANELRTVLYKIDLSTVVSKYIGETEKNLSKIFREAETGNCILLFDEADAIFGKRSTVKDARDRYANIETSYLLQKMEEYEGIVILTTNLLGNIDTAFVRRIKYIVHFPKPDAKMRSQIWRGVWPNDMPVDPRVNFDYIAKTFEFSGGNIKNAALAASFLAAKENKPVDNSHIATAVRRETSKIGEIISESQFSIPDAPIEVPPTSAPLEVCG